MLVNVVRLGLSRLTSSAYTPNPTLYDGLFPNGTPLTAATTRRNDATRDDRPPPDDR